MLLLSITTTLTLFTLISFVVDYRTNKLAFGELSLFEKICRVWVVMIGTISLLAVILYLIYGTYSIFYK